jgi:5-formyltetrahydrofolate cyclo-ligase
LHNAEVAAKKALLRAELRSKRRELSATTRDTAAVVAAQLFAQIPFFKKARHIACYHACHSELSLQPLMELIWQTDKVCYLPIITPDQPRLSFVAFDKNESLSVNHRGILEPTLKINHISPAELDIVLVPLLGFDRKGHRLGTGGGYYDQTFAFLNKEPKPLRPQLIGVAYACQYVDNIPTESWDVLLDGVLTEQEVLLF